LSEAGNRFMESPGECVIVVSPGITGKPVHRYVMDLPKTFQFVRLVLQEATMEILICIILGIAFMGICYVGYLALWALVGA
jgi:hypothetical protein